MCPSMMSRGETPVFVLSSPGGLTRTGGALRRARNHDSMQILLGADAQLHAIAAALARRTAEVFVAVAPEIYSSGESLPWLARAAGLAVPDLPRIQHLRFGPVRCARMLHGATNRIITVETPPPQGQVVVFHPYASGRVLPNTVDQILHPDTITPPALTTIRGASPPMAALPGALFAADLAHDVFRHAFAAQVQGPHDLGGLFLHSFQDYNRFDWSLNEDRYAQCLSPAARRFLGQKPFMVMLPWNLAHPASIVPDLVEKLAQFTLDDPAAPGFAVFPFNIGPHGHYAIHALVQKVEWNLGLHRGTGPKDEAQARLQRIFLGKAANLPALARLHRLCPVAWIDMTDPEAEWSVQRLNSCGIRDLRLGGAPGRNAVPMRDSFPLAVPDMFGTQIFNLHGLMPRDLPALLHETGQALNTPALIPLPIGESDVLASLASLLP